VVVEKLEVIIFGLVWFLFKKITKLIFLKKPKPNQNWYQPVSVRFGLVFRKKTSSNRFGSVFSVWLGFGLVFSVLTLFFFSVWIRFGFFGFKLIKPKLNRTGQFF
jgi:hypothetical protein